VALPAQVAAAVEPPTLASEAGHSPSLVSPTLVRAIGHSLLLDCARDTRTP